MADFTFLFNRKGALYPIDYDSAIPLTPLTTTTTTTTTTGSTPDATDTTWPYDNKNKVSSLVYLCCKVIASDATLTDRVTNVIPSELYVPLFKASLYPVKDVTIDILINKWPFKSLILRTYTKTMFSSFILLYNELEMCQRTRLGVKYSADVVHSFIEALRKRQTKLRYLDLTGFPIAEIIIKYVATHCRLAQKEYQRNCLIDEYFQNVSDLEQLSEKPTTIRNDLRKTTSLPDEQLVFRFDCILQERTTFEELIGALNANTNNRFQLQIIKLDLLCLGKGNIIKLLGKLDKNYIEGLRLQYNSITEESIKDIIPLLSQLRNLKALDLSCNLIDYRQNSDCCQLMSDALSELKHLNRIDLSGSPLGGCLSTLLSKVELPIEYLGLHSCGLIDSDLNYIQQSVHAESLKHLDLSENRLTRFMESLMQLMKKCSPTLNVIELDDNRFDCIDYLNIICIARKMKQLKLIATKGTYEINDHLLASRFLAQSQSLIAWRISYPIDIYSPNSNDVQAQEYEKTQFIQRMLTEIKNKFKIIIHELFL